MSARGNALALDSRISGRPLVRALNGIAPDIFFTASREVPDSFHAWHATGRHYVYLMVGEPRRLDRWQAGARMLTGALDVRSFGRGIPTERPVFREVESIRLETFPGGLRIDVRAPAFVWGMVRKIVAALQAYDRGALSLEALEAAARGRRRVTLALAAPESLILWAVEYGEPWENEIEDRSRHQARFLDQEASTAARRRWLLPLLGAQS